MKYLTNRPEECGDNFNLAYEFVRALSDMDYEYAYRGEFTKSIVANIISVASSCIVTQPQTIKKRIFFILVECLQNIAKHQDKLPDNVEHEPAIVIIQKRNRRYYVTTGNILENSHVEDLKLKLTKINDMEAKQLKEYYNEVLLNLEISDKGGAGLGLISMARKTVDNKLYYDFKKINDKLSYFYLRTEIPIEKKIDHKVDTKWKYSFNAVELMHETLSEERILLNFSGVFDKNNLDNLIPIVDAQLYSDENLKKRMFAIIYGMLSNIVDYSEDYLSTGRKIGNNNGVFLLSTDKNNKLMLTSGNYIHDSVVPLLQQKIDLINKAKEQRLITFYENLSEYFTEGSLNQPDLRLIEMKFTSRNDLIYQFVKVNEFYSFFTLRVIIDAG